MAALLENSQGSFVQGDLGVPSHLVSEMASNIALNIKPEMSIGFVASSARFSASPFAFSKFKKDVSKLTRNSGL